MAGSLKILVPELQFGGDETLFNVWMIVKTPDNKIFLGFGAYSTMQVQPGAIKGDDGDDGDDEDNGATGPPGPVVVIAGLWEHLSGGPSDDFYIQALLIQVNKSDYFNTSQLNTQFNLLKNGWYRFHIKLLWTSLISGEIYRLEVEKNGAQNETLERWEHDLTNQFYLIEKEFYIFNDGNLAIRLHCTSDGGDPFQIYVNDGYHQFVIEYLGVY